MGKAGKWLKRNAITMVLVVLFLAGVGLILYPSVSNYWNSFHQSKAIAGYSEAVANLDEATYKKIWKAAKKYNKKISKGIKWNLSDEELEEYNSLLDVTGTGIMGYIEIKKIDCYLPIYHGTDEGVLQIAVGHIEGTSLPIGGKSTHFVLSGHRGLPSAKLFSNLDEMEEGDTFVIRTMNKTLTYEVDQILIVEPDDLSALKIEEGKDLCTLVTCTPYGINTHRLLVRGHRIANQPGDDGIRVTADATQISSVLIAPLVAVPLYLILIIQIMVTTRKKKDR